MTNSGQEKPFFADIQNPKPKDLLYFFGVAIQCNSNAQSESIQYSRILITAHANLNRIGLIFLASEAIAWFSTENHIFLRVLTMAVGICIAAKLGKDQFDKIQYAEEKLDISILQITKVKEDTQFVLEELALSEE